VPRARARPGAGQGPQPVAASGRCPGCRPSRGPAARGGLAGPPSASSHRRCPPTAHRGGAAPGGSPGGRDARPTPALAGREAPRRCSPPPPEARPGALGARRGTRGSRATPAGEAQHGTTRGVVDGGGLRGARQRAWPLRGLPRTLFDSRGGSQRPGAPPWPPAVDCVASLPDAAPGCATTNRPRFPCLPRLLDSTAIWTFLRRHPPSPMEERQAIHRTCAARLSRIGTRGKGAHVEQRPRGHRSRRKDIRQPCRIFYSLGLDPRVRDGPKRCASNCKRNPMASHKFSCRHPP
jgi:hypothetical protein